MEADGQHHICIECARIVVWDYMGSGIKFCTTCGAMSRGTFEEYDIWSPNEQLTRSCYTRSKRFQKYLANACHMQSSSSVPNVTWEHLINHGPYSRPSQIIRTLKKSKLKRKCYDSLPLMCAQMCPEMTVPTLDPGEFRRALEYFGVVEKHYKNKTSFISYLYILEYILHKLGRQDMCPFLSRIQCRQRRYSYNLLLDSIFGERVSVNANI